MAIYKMIAIFTYIKQNSIYSKNFYSKLKERDTSKL